MVRAFLITILAAFMAGSALASELRIVDGDTIRLGRERIRIVGYDSPEVQGRCPSEQLAARAARGRSGQLLGGGQRIPSSASASPYSAVSLTRRFRGFARE